MCWASGMSIHGLTGTVIFVSTGMRSSQVSQVVHRQVGSRSPWRAATGVGQGLRSSLAIWKRLSIFPTICLSSMGKVGSGPDAALLGSKPSPAHPKSCLVGAPPFLLMDTVGYLRMGSWRPMDLVHCIPN